MEWRAPFRSLALRSRRITLRAVQHGAGQRVGRIGFAGRESFGRQEPAPANQSLHDLTNAGAQSLRRTLPGAPASSGGFWGLCGAPVSRDAFDRIVDAARPVRKPNVRDQRRKIDLPDGAVVLDGRRVRKGEATGKTIGREVLTPPRSMWADDHVGISYRFADGPALRAPASGAVCSARATSSALSSAHSCVAHVGGDFRRHRVRRTQPETVRPS